MSALKHACARLIALFRREALDRDFDEEAQSHLDLAVEDYVRRGTPETEARRLARVKFGAVEASKDAHRDSRGVPWLEGLLYDPRFALRGLRRDWAFSLAAITMLALAIGLNATSFTVMNAMLFRGDPLAKRSDRLVYMQVRRPSGPWSVSYADFEAWRSQAQAFEGLAFTGGGVPITFRDGDGRPIDISMQRWTANSFRLLGVRPVLGRDFVPADEIAGAAPVVILSYRFWESRFATRTDIVGMTVHINGAPATVIGVMPEGFVSERSLWMPLADTPELHQKGFGGSTFGRLRDGATLHAAQAELDTINRRLAAADPATNRDVVPSVLTYSQAFVGPDAPMIYGSMWVGAWLVWLIACANLVNLTLVRTMGRRRELSTRIALGAGHARVMRQMFVESLTLAAMAGVLGWWITTWSVHTWAAATQTRGFVLDYRLDAGTFAYVMGISLAAAIICSLAPMVRVRQLGVRGALKSDASGVTQGLRGKHLAGGLVAGQMALAIVLLSGAGVLVRSLVKVVGAETGVRDPEHLLVGSMRVPLDKYQGPATRLGYFDRLDAQLMTIPGIEEASVASTIPVNGVFLRPFEIEGKPSPPDNGRSARFLTAGSGYFRMMGASAISGRTFNDGDHLATPNVAIVNESFAAQFWPGESPVGKRLRPIDRSTPGEWRTIVGVVPNIMQGDALRENFKPLIYLPFRQEPTALAVNRDGVAFNGAYFLVRMGVPADRVAHAVRAEVQNVDPGVILEEFTTLKASFAFNRGRMDLAHAELGKHAAVAPVLALVALLLAAIGLYAVIAHSVSQRTREIGVRMAIGARAEDIWRLVFREGMTPVVVGLTLGLFASFAVNRLLQSQLVGVSPNDPVTLATSHAVLILVALLACHIPSRLALRVDPAVALRHD